MSLSTNIRASVSWCFCVCFGHCLCIRILLFERGLSVEDTRREVDQLVNLRLRRKEEKKRRREKEEEEVI